jgi:hypothetical protein
MLFSEHYNITRTDDDDWFDPILTLDTTLFLDPFLIYADERGYFEGSHEEVIRFFDEVFKLVASSHEDRSSNRYKKALADLVFPEVKEICLGYTKEGTDGLGSSGVIARLIASGLSEAIRAGLTEITHFEEVGIIRKNIGADRISDITAGLLRWRLAAYTLDVCKRHNVPTRMRRHSRGRYDAERRTWVPLMMPLPDNPHNGKGILLAPRRYLRALPTINSDDFWDYCYSNENDTLRAEFSHDITSRVNKDVIVDLARKRPDLLKKYLHDVETQDPRPYDFSRDTEGVVAWYEPTREYCARHPVSLDSRAKAALLNFVEVLLKRFQHFVEQEDGWRLLWDGNRRKNEPAARNLLLGIIMHYCRANNVVVSPLPLVGKDLVNLSVSDGDSVEVLLELKLAVTTRYWNALHKEAPNHEKAGLAELARFIVVTFSDADDDRYKEITDIVGKLKPEYGMTILRVDASSDDADDGVPATVQFVARDNAVIHVGDNFVRIDGNVTGAAIGPGASVIARDISTEGSGS